MVKIGDDRTDTQTHVIGQIVNRYLEQLALRFSLAHNNAASKSAVDMLATIEASEELLNSDSSKCVVCKNKFNKGNELKELPCNHVYHKDCILPWFKRHNTCPVCRDELPIDDQVQSYIESLGFTISLQLRFRLLEDDDNDNSTQQNPDGSGGIEGSHGS